MEQAVTQFYRVTFSLNPRRPPAPAIAASNMKLHLPLPCTYLHIVCLHGQVRARVKAHRGTGMETSTGD